VPILDENEWHRCHEESEREPSQSQSKTTSIILTKAVSLWHSFFMWTGVNCERSMKVNIDKKISIKVWKHYSDPLLCNVNFMFFEVQRKSKKCDVLWICTMILFYFYYKYQLMWCNILIFYLVQKFLTFFISLMKFNKWTHFESIANRPTLTADF
jgi:hypothetical protein